MVPPVIEFLLYMLFQEIAIIDRVKFINVRLEKCLEYFNQKFL